MFFMISMVSFFLNISPRAPILPLFAKPLAFRSDLLMDVYYLSMYCSFLLAIDSVKAAFASTTSYFLYSINFLSVLVRKQNNSIIRVG